MQEPNVKIGRILKLIHTTIKTAENKNLIEKNLTSSQMEILIFIAKEELEKKEINQVDIEKHFSLTNPTVTGLLNRLQEKNFIKRVPSKKDARFNSIVLSSKGQKIMEDCHDEIERFDKILTSNLSEEEKDELIRLLEKVLTSIHKEDNLK